MEQLRAELSTVLGEDISRLECVSEKAQSAALRAV